MLSFYAATALSDPGIRRYDELFDRINALVRASNDALIADNVPAELPSPEGRLDLPVLGQAAPAEARRGWAIEIPAGAPSLDRLRLAAGSLAGVVPGTLFAIGAPDDGRPLLFGRAEAVDPWTSVLRPAAYGGIGEHEWQIFRPTGAILFAREVERPLAPAIRVRPPRAARTAVQRAAMRAIASLDRTAAGVWLERSGEAALVLRFQGDTLELATGDRPTARVYGRIAIGHVAPDAIRSELATAFARAARFRRIADILDTLSLQPGEGRSAGRCRTRRFLPAPPGYRARAGCALPTRRFRRGRPHPPRRARAAAARTGGRRRPRLARCDALYLSFANRGPKPLYLVPIILAPEGAIYILPTQDFGSMLFEPGRAGTARYLLSTDPGGEPARDDLYLLAIEAGADDRTPALSLAIEQPPILCRSGTPNCADASQPNARSGPETTSANARSARCSAKPAPSRWKSAAPAFAGSVGIRSRNRNRSNYGDPRRADRD